MWSAALVELGCVGDGGAAVMRRLPEHVILPCFLPELGQFGRRRRLFDAIELVLLHCFSTLVSSHSQLHCSE